MTDDAGYSGNGASWGEGAAPQPALDAALARAFPTPSTPADLRAGVLAAIAREPKLDWQARRDALEREHRAAIARLNRRYLRRCRDALLLGACLFAVLGLSIEPLSVWLTPIIAAAAPLVAGLIALSVGVLCGAAILQDLFRAKAAPHGCNKFEV